MFEAVFQLGKDALFVYRHNETIAPTTYRPNEALAAPIVTHSVARLHDSMIQSSPTHEAFRPDVLYDLLSGHDTVTVRDEIGEDIEHLRFNRIQDISTPECVEPGVEDILAKKINHGHSPCRLMAIHPTGSARILYRHPTCHERSLHR
jgi:hypothetical protein